MKSLFKKVDSYTLIVHEEDLINVLSILDINRLDRFNFSMGRVENGKEHGWFINITATDEQWADTCAAIQHRKINVLIAEKDENGKPTYREL